MTRRLPAQMLSLTALMVGTALAGNVHRQPVGNMRRGMPVEVTAVRFWSLREVTRIAIETTNEFKYHWERLQNPDRFFFDIEGAQVRIDGKRYHTAAVGDRLLKRVRVAQRTPEITRVVLDVESGVEVSVSQLENPDRLMIELRGPAGATPQNTSVAEAPNAPPVPATINSPSPAIENPPAIKATLPKSETARLPAAIMKTAEPGDTTQTSAPAALSVPQSAPKAARHTAAGSNSLIRALGLKVNRVALDAGHGGQDEGTVGPHGLMEKELVLDVTKRLGKLIEQRMGSEVIYTRTDDTFIPLQARTELANQKKADLFLSIHANSSPYAKVGGIETFYLNFTRSSEALDVAARENASSQKSVYELRDLIQTITLSDKVEESKEFAGRIQTALYTFSARYNTGIKNRGVKKAPFVVLVGASMPSVLAEIGFLSNAKDEALLKKPEHRQRLAEALYRGVARYAQTLSHFQVAQANTVQQ